MANTLFENEVLANKYESVLMTQLDLNQFMTTDTTLS